MLEFTLLFVAGVIGGVMNAVAGGGTFITFPALVFAGVPPIAANATSTVAALPGYLTATLGFRRDLAAMEGAPMLKLTLWTVVGGAVGCGLLLVSSNAAFAVLVPFLLLVATVIFYWSDTVRRLASRWRSVVTPFGLGTLLPMSIYGGYFNGGLGIIMLAVFAMWGMTDLHQMNGLKSWLSFALAVIAAVVFAVGGKIVWVPAAMVSAGTIIGGYAGAPVARRIPRHTLRLLIAAVGFGMSAIFFWRLINGG
ncbi:sulfite exporter TauE/SafE family protein [Paracoccus marinaquae]|uniref:Probable membrane transporter protein n=1 Tax=Paracoccus marinaquae TaxID=2841926 RepID=A0ABS6AGU3_9RHOB|nr:sulfite exporter TauE/SafE family protein [Paracoccus marinaquae]MBU3029805.1 sulfite exporter TauE/SafE family protein [Paracoccus marinaquae]